MILGQNDLQQAGRLALRVEGENWNAYYAMPDTMDGALYLGSIRMALVQDKVRKQVFMDLMRSAVGSILGGIVGAEPSWKEPIAAPEHERTKE